jgi:hypothetical protein
LEKECAPTRKGGRPSRTIIAGIDIALVLYDQQALRGNPPDGPEPDSPRIREKTDLRLVDPSLWVLVCGLNKMRHELRVHYRIVIE